jgi:hypothetical protein
VIWRIDDPPEHGFYTQERFYRPTGTAVDTQTGTVILRKVR